MNEPTQPLETGTILVVDDTPANLRVLIQLLSSKGYNVHPAPSGERALQFVQVAHPDLILLDIVMPGIDGFAVCAELKTHPHTSDIPVIFLSAEHDLLNKVQAFALGGVDYITKPFQAEEVLARVATHLSLSRLRHDLEAQVQQRTQALTAANEQLKAEIAERKRLEEQLLQAQKMESIGQLAGGVAHDFNNLLTAIAGYADLLREDFAPDNPAQHDLDEIIRAAERAANLTRQLLAFARKQVIEPRVLNLNTLLTGVCKLVGRLIGEDIELITVLAPNLGLVKIDPIQIEQVVINLAINARHAQPHGGKITIETRNVVLGGEPRPYAALEPGPYVALSVSDTGIGIRADLLDRIFEPFFTTREPGEGSGLGLAMCYGIIKQHGGHITVDSELGHGTTFKIFLPRVSQAAAAPIRPDPPATRLHGSETILVVEDDPAVRALTVQVLRQHGYQVFEAAHGEEALRLARTAGAALALLVTDLVMPHMSGDVLAGRLSGLYPQMKVLFISGYTNMLEDTPDRPKIPLLHKPFAPHTLALKVRQVLDT